LRDLGLGMAGFDEEIAVMARSEGARSIGWAALLRDVGRPSRPSLPNKIARVLISAPGICLQV
jgi:hypothetical protein